MQTAVYLVYDMELSAEENRVIDPDPGWPDYVRRVGFPIYPEHYAENQTYHWEEQLRSGSPWYTQRSPLSWTPDGEHVVFAAAQPSGDDAEFGSTMVLVRVDLRVLIDINLPTLFVDVVDNSIRL